MNKKLSSFEEAAERLENAVYSFDPHNFDIDDVIDLYHYLRAAHRREVCMLKRALIQLVDKHDKCPSDIREIALTALAKLAGVNDIGDDLYNCLLEATISKCSSCQWGRNNGKCCTRESPECHVEFWQAALTGWDGTEWFDDEEKQKKWRD